MKVVDGYLAKADNHFRYFPELKHGVKILRTKARSYKKIQP